MNTASITLSNICYAINKKTIFSQFNHTFGHDSIVPIVGPSGCGKSTLLNITSGLLRPEQGIVQFEMRLQTEDSGGVRVVSTPVTGPSSEIMVMNQTYTNFPWVSCFENTLFQYRFSGKRTKEAEQEAVEVLHKVGLGNYVDRYPDSLSGGMKQRLALARVFCAKAPVVMMDEPLSALDDKTRTAMQKLLLEHQAATKCTMVIITHNLDEAEVLKCNADILTLPKGAAA